MRRGREREVYLLRREWGGGGGGNREGVSLLREGMGK